MSSENLRGNQFVLITGAAGFIGFHLVNRLCAIGENVIGYDNLNDFYDIGLKMARLDQLKEYSNFTFIKGDLEDFESINKVFVNHSITIVINLAAQAGVRYSIENPRAYIQSNVVGFFNILECCRHHEIEHLVYASSSSVYGGNKKVPFSIDDKVDNPVSLYAATKKSNELMAYTYSKLYNISCTGLRFFTVYGPWGRPDMAYFSFTEKIMNNEQIEIYNHGDMLRDFTYIDDIIEALMKVINKTPKVDSDGVSYKIYNIGNSKPEKLDYLIELLEGKLGKKAKKVFLPMQQGDVYQTFADVTELERDFGFSPHTALSDGIAEFCQWFLWWKNSKTD